MLPKKMIINSLLINAIKTYDCRGNQVTHFKVEKYTVTMSLSSWGELSEQEMDPSIGKYICTQLLVC